MVRSVAANVNAGDQPTVVFNLTPAPGNLLVAFVGYVTTQTATPPDSNWVLVESADSDPYRTARLGIWYYNVPASPPSTYTFTFSTSSLESGVVFEVSGHDAAMPIDQPGLGTGLTPGISTTIGTSSVVPTVVGDLVLAGASTDGNETLVGVSAGWTADKQNVPSGNPFHKTFTALRNTNASDTFTAISNTFTFAVAAVAKLSFVVQPTSVEAGTGIAPAVQVAVQDAFGNTDSSSTVSITVSVASNPGGGALGGATVADAVGG